MSAHELKSPTPTSKSARDVFRFLMGILLRSRYFLLSRFKSLMGFQRFDHTFSASPLSEALQDVDMSKWSKFDANKLGISGSLIPSSSWIVLKTLRRKGFEAYLVGGCVRDLILRKTPKDFDIITTASLSQIKLTFHRALIIGRRFPICMVHIRGCAIEVSSFETVANKNEAEEKQNVYSSEKPKGCSDKDFVLWRNSMQRDFTINSLFLDPFMSKIYDYTGGMWDLMSLKLRTLIPAHLSFHDDCARILRGLRIAARLGLSFSKDTESAMHELSSSVGYLDKFRLMMELNYLLSYGAAMSSVGLLQRFKLLEILLPFHASYIDQQQAARNPLMLMELLSNLDKLVSCDQPADSSLWVGILAFHLALVHNPQDALVVWALASIFYKGSWKEGVKFARAHAKDEVKFVPEVSGFSNVRSDEDLAKELSQLASLIHDSVSALTEADDFSELMSRYPLFPSSGLVFVPKKTGRLVAKVYDVLVDDIESYENKRKDLSIDYCLLGKGDQFETRFVLGKIILDTMNGVPIKGVQIVEDNNNELRPHDLPLSDLIKSAIMSGKGRKHDWALLTAETVQEIRKKRKDVGRQISLSEPRSSKDEKDVIVEEIKGIVEVPLLPDAETSRKQGNVTDRKEYLENQEVTLKNLSLVETDDYQGEAQIHVKPIQKVQHHISADENNRQEAGAELSFSLKTLKKQIKLVKGNLNQGKIVVQKRLEGTDHTLVAKKTKEHRKVVNKEKLKKPSLSSLFK